MSHYKILEKIGEGGMGVVYKAQDMKLDRPVALKFLAPHLFASEQSKARFLQEARSAAALNHPNICSVIEIQEYPEPGEGDSAGAGEMFIVMEYIDGQTLHETLHAPNAAPLPIKRALEIGIQIADGLAAAHDKGIVHRDIKPENVMVRKDGIVQIMDFGLAKLKSGSAPRLTEVGSTVGTAGYMSPEHLQGQDGDHRSDIFSLGVLLYELFTGARPFKGAHNAALTYEIVNVDPPAMSTIRPQIDRELDRIVMACLEKDPAERCQSAPELAKELRRAKRALDQSAVHRFPDPSEHAASAEKLGDESNSRFGVPPYARLAVFFVIIGLAFAALVWWKPWRGRDLSPQPVARFILPMPSRAVLELAKDGLALSPDGRHLAYIAKTDTGSMLFLRNLDNFDSKPVMSTAGLGISGLFFSPDGQWLGFFANGKMMKLSLGGGSPVAICDALAGEASWGDGGNIVFMQVWGSILWIVSSESGSTARPLTRLDLEAGERAHILPCVLPGGREALFTIWRGSSYGDNLIAAVDLKTGEYHTVLRGGAAPTYLKSGLMIYVRSSTLMAVPFDLNNLKITGEPVPMLEGVLMNGNDAHSYYALSTNGTLVYAQGGVEFDPTSVSIVDRDGRSRPIELEGENIGLPVFSPDGTKLAVVITGPTYQIGVYDLQRRVLTHLTFSADNFAPVWVRDGSRIIFDSNLDGKYRYYGIAADGSGAPQKLFVQEETLQPGKSWSSDGKHMAYVVVNKETGTDIWTYSPGEIPASRPIIATRAKEDNPVFSPDGHWIAYQSDQSGDDEIYVEPYPPSGARWRISQNGGQSPRWSADGGRIFYKRNNEILFVHVSAKPGKSGQTFDAGREELFHFCPGLNSFDLSPNGRTAVIAQTSTKGTVNHLNVVLHWTEELKGKF